MEEASQAAVSVRALLETEISFIKVIKVDRMAQSGGAPRGSQKQEERQEPLVLALGHPLSLPGSILSLILTVRRRLPSLLTAHVPVGQPRWKRRTPRRTLRGSACEHSA